MSERTLYKIAFIIVLVMFFISVARVLYLVDESCSTCRELP